MAGDQAPGGADKQVYQRSLDWLYQQSRGEAPRDPLRMASLIEALELTLPPRSLYVVGTNGKGTVTSMSAAALTAAGVRCGWFTSPHVEDFSERIGVDGVAIRRCEVIAFVEHVRGLTLPFRPAFFELCLAMAFDHFQRANVAFAAVEAGVGARNDATAVLTGVSVTAVTPIALDHLDTLGPTLTDIARDKSAAIRPGIPVASARQAPEVLEVLTAACRESGSPLHVDDPDDDLFRLPQSIAREPDPVRQRNQRLAAATARLSGAVPEGALAAGLSIAPLPGRGERFMVGDAEVLLDGAHDPAAAASLIERTGREYVLVFGSLAKKQGEATLQVLEPSARQVFVTDANGEASNLERVRDRNYIAKPEEALRMALAQCGPGSLLIVAGSLYLAGELRPLLRDLADSTGRLL